MLSIRETAFFVAQDDLRNFFEATRGEQGATDAETVRAKTVSEIDKGLADGFFDKEDLDAMWGYHGYAAGEARGGSRKGKRGEDTTGTRPGRHAGAVGKESAAP